MNPLVCCRFKARCWVLREPGLCTALPHLPAEALALVLEYTSELDEVLHDAAPPWGVEVLQEERGGEAEVQVRFLDEKHDVFSVHIVEGAIVWVCKQSNEHVFLDMEFDGEQGLQILKVSRPPRVAQRQAFLWLRLFLDYAVRGHWLFVLLYSQEVLVFDLRRVAGDVFLDGILDSPIALSQVHGFQECLLADEASTKALYKCMDEFLMPFERRRQVASLLCLRAAFLCQMRGGQ